MGLGNETKECGNEEILFDYIEVFYNSQRLHSGSDYNYPASYCIAQ